LAKKYKAKQTFGLGAKENDKHAEADIRWQRIVHNDIENVFLGLILAWCSLLSIYSSQVHIVSVVVFTLARIMHTLSYAYSLQPHRAIGWFVAVLAMLAMVINGAAGVMVM
jgi:glutathione S-transferase